MPCKDPSPSDCCQLARPHSSLSPPSSVQRSHNAGLASEPWTWQDCPLLRACARAAWHVLPVCPKVTAWRAPLFHLVLCLNVSPKRFHWWLWIKQDPCILQPLTLLYVCRVLSVTTWNQCVLCVHLYRRCTSIYSFVCCLTPAVDCQLHQGRECSMHIKQCLA